ncbi:MAG: hypothetical protein C4576_25590 [Desulfobacteraceae bacterium]|nr:MAG: hypothetical protein C4576_25590 [Desulfobacteraceae bacterium]
MHIYTQLYEFASSAGAFEGYVYRRTNLDMDALPVWVENLRIGYSLIPPEILREIQPAVDSTLGRAYQSIADTLGEESAIAGKLRTMIRGALPASPDEFKKKKWFQSGTVPAEREER